MANKLTKLTNEDKNKVLSGTSYVLPNNPSNKGWTADQIRQKGYQGLIAIFDLINTKFQAIIDDLNDRVLNNDFGEFQTEITNNLNQINSSFASINTDITNLKNGVSENTSTITSNYNELTTRVNDLYYQLSKVSTDTFPTRDEVNSEIGRLTSLINSAIEVANGKTATYVLSYSFPLPTEEELSNSLNYLYENGYPVRSYADLKEYLGTDDVVIEEDYVNANFNSQEDFISLNNNGHYIGFVIVEGANETYIFKKVFQSSATLNIGDIILVKETNVPDRWISYNYAYKMETTKIDLSEYYTKGEINSLVENYRDIKEINTQYIRIWDLDVGIYKLTYNGTKYIYYNGASGTQTRSLNTGVALLQITNNESGQKSWFTIYTGPYNGSYYGKTSSTSGEFTQTYNFSPIYRVNKSTLVADIFAPTTAGSSGQVLISNGSGAPVWENITPYSVIKSLEFFENTQVDIDLTSTFSELNTAITNGKNVNVMIMPLNESLDLWVDNNVYFEITSGQTNPLKISFFSNNTFDTKVKVNITAQIVNEKEEQ